MQKEIKLYEMFAGIGSQYKALKNIATKLNIKVTSLDACEFYIDAIISYTIIHYGLLKPEKKMDKQEIINILSKLNLSSDSKKVVLANYFKKMKEEKLRQIFPYLFSFVNNDYFNKVFNISEKEPNWYN